MLSAKTMFLLRFYHRYNEKIKISHIFHENPNISLDCHLKHCFVSWFGHTSNELIRISKMFNENLNISLYCEQKQCFYEDFIISIMT